MFRFIKAIEDLTKALNRLMDFFDALQQKEVDRITTLIKATNDRLEGKLQRRS